MSTADQETLRGAGSAIGLELNDHQLHQLVAFRDALLKWNKVYNLTAIRQPQEMLQQHLVDCLAIVPAVRRQLQAQRLVAEAGSGSKEACQAPDDSPRILDVGSGGGLPGVVLAIALPEVRIDCVDTVAKKAAFVRQVAVEMKLSNLRALHNRVEDLRPHGPGGQAYDLITSRAFASLNDFTSLTRHLLAPSACWAAMKGQKPDSEIAAVKQGDPEVDVFHVEPLTWPGLEAQRCIVWMSLRASKL